MASRSKKKAHRTKIYLSTGLVRTAKAHSVRNGFTLSGWVSLLLQKALGRKNNPLKKSR